MVHIKVFTTNYCPYCDRAKALLDKKSLAYEEIDVTHDLAMREELVKMTNGRKTVPQIFIKDQHIGGCDDLYALDAEGKLDAMLL